METVEFRVEKKQAGKRLDRFLVEVFQGRFSRSFIKRLIQGADVLVCGRTANAHHKMRVDESVKVTIPPPKGLNLKCENIPLDIVYEDKDLLVVNKPAGMLVHPVGRTLTGTLVNALLYHCKELSGIGGVLRPGIVHRLDKDTSGLLVIAKNDIAHKNLAGQFKNHTIKRKYIALVRGVVQLDNGRIELPIAPRKKQIAKMGVSYVDTKRKSAITNYKVLKRFKDFTMLELMPHTGRTHQIRVHLSYMGHPIIGDKLYGSPKGLSRQALHAVRVGFFHPTTKGFMEFESELPQDMQDLIKRGRL